MLIICSYKNSTLYVDICRPEIDTSHLNSKDKVMKMVFSDVHILKPQFVSTEFIIVHYGSVAVKVKEQLCYSVFLIKP